MRDDLIGYLLDALDPEQQERVEARLSRDPHLRRDLETLSRSIEPLSADKEHYQPPVGLAHRTCQHVAGASRAHVSPPVVSVPGRWSLADMAVAAGIFLAATFLFWPAMNQSRFAARLAGCQDNLRQLGVALTNYSTRYPGQFPAAALSSNLNRAGVYAVILRQEGLLPQTRVVICPASLLADRASEYDVPTPQQVMQARAEQAIVLRRMMGGSYGFSLGYYVDGRYQPPKNLGRARQALMSDAPSANTPHRFSLNHGRYGQNVLFEDMHVQYLTTCKASGCTDHIFFNDEGRPRAGLHDRDSVIGASDDQPLEWPMLIEELETPLR